MLSLFDRAVIACDEHQIMLPAANLDKKNNVCKDKKDLRIISKVKHDKFISKIKKLHYEEIKISYPLNLVGPGRTINLPKGYKYLALMYDYRNEEHYRAIIQDGSIIGSLTDIERLFLIVQK